MKSRNIYLLLAALILHLSGCQASEEKKVESEDLGIVPVSLQLQWVTQAQFAGFYVALEKGWYLEEGLDVTIYQGGPDAVPVELVTGGSRDFGTNLLPDLAVSIGQGKEIVAISQIQQANGLRLLARKNSGIKKPKDFIGKKVGVWLGSWEIQFFALLASVGVDPKDVDIVSQGWSMRPFVEGELDVASAMIYNEYYKVIESGISKDDLYLIDYKDYRLDFPGDAIFTSLRMVQENPEMCRKMVRASLRGWEYAFANPEEAVNIILKHDKSEVQSFDHQFKMLIEINRMRIKDGIEFGTFNPGRIEKMIELLVDYHLMKKPVALEKVFTSEFIH